MAKAPRITSEFLAEQATDPRHQQAMRERERLLSERRLVLSKDEHGLVDELNVAGANVQSVWDLVNRKDPYPLALTILERHLNQPHHVRIQEGIIRALAVSYAPDSILDSLIDRYQLMADSENILWVLAYAIGCVAKRGHSERIIQLLGDQKNGKSRSGMIQNITRFVSDGRVLFERLRALESEGGEIATVAASVRSKVFTKNSRASSRSRILRQQFNS